MTNIDCIEKDYFVILLIDEERIPDRKYRINNFQITIRALVDDIVDTLKLPIMNEKGNSIKYMLEVIIETCEKPIILEFENEYGRENTLADFRVLSGTVLHLFSFVDTNIDRCRYDNRIELTAGRKENKFDERDVNKYKYDNQKNHVEPNQTLIPKSPLISFKATGRDINEGTAFDRTKRKISQKHILPEKTTFSKRLIRRVSELFKQQKTVNSTVFAPSMAERGEVMTIQLLLYTDSQYSNAIKKAKKLDPDAVEKTTSVMGVPLKKGDVVTAHLSFFAPNVKKEYIIIQSNDKKITWTSNIEAIIFSVYIDKHFNRKLLNGKVDLMLDGVPIEEITFCIKIVNGNLGITALADTLPRRFDKVFISYSHEDADKVQYISETCKAVKCNYFFDRHSLAPGDVFPEKIFKYIDNADLFILCWSENAAASEWVRKERKRALDNWNRDNKSLRFYPISIPPIVELPNDMREIFNFGYLS